MRHSGSDRRQTTGSGRSGRLALNPYCMEDIAMTAGELYRARTATTVVHLPR